jgi:6-phosphogluconolactonase
MQLAKFDSQPDWVQASKQFVLEALNSEGDFNIGLSGGKTPLLVYQSLSLDPRFDASKGVFWLVDERNVPLADPESNYRNITEAFVSSPNFKSNLSFWHTNLPSVEALAKFNTEMRQWFANKIDLIVLGIGKDGHTASLFPHSSVLKQTKELVAETKSSVGVPQRFTITFPAIMKAKKVLLLAAGRDKQDVIGKLMNTEGSIEETPARELHQHTDAHVFYLQNN